jgi:hypothetical protein
MKHRRPGAGRKPKKGPLRTAPLSVRLPDYLRDQLRAAAKGHNRGVSQELIDRLNDSFEREQDPAANAFAYLIAEVANHLRVMPTWSRNPFLFEAFREGVAALLANFDSGQEPKLAPVLEAYRAGVERAAATINKGQPIRQAPGQSLDKWIDMQVADLAKRWQTPEAAGIDAARSVLARYHGPSPGERQAYLAMLEDEQAGRVDEADWFYKGAIERAKDLDARMAQARRALRPSKSSKRK